MILFDENSYLNIVLDDERNRNAIGAEQAQQLKSGLEKFRKAKGLIIKNNGDRSFCSGGNIKEQSEAHKSKGLKTQQIMAGNIEKISRFPGPTIALVNGDALGGGVELLSAFDYVIAAPHCMFGLWQRKIGISFGWSGYQQILARLGTKILADLYLSQKIISAYSALSIGLIDEIQLSGRLEIRGLEKINQLSNGSEATFLSHRKLNVKNEKKIFRQLWNSKEHWKIISKLNRNSSSQRT